MSKDSTKKRVIKVLGSAVWLGGLVLILRRTFARTLGGDAVDLAERTDRSIPDLDAKAKSDGAGTTAFAEETSVEPDVSSGDETVVTQGVNTLDDDLLHRQHEDLGGIPEKSNREGAGARASLVDEAPYDANFADEDVALTLVDDTDKGGEVPLDEGIPNLGEPGAIEDVNTVLAAEEAVVEEPLSGLPEEYGQDESIDSVTDAGPYVSDVGTESAEIPAASRGFREYGESEVDDEQDGLSIGIEPESLDAANEGTGGEVDLENDEAPAWDDEGMSVVDDPDEPLSEDAGGLLDSEPTLGLRDSESPGVDDVKPVDSSEEDEGRAGNLGLTGDYDKADATTRIAASPGQPGDKNDQNEEERRESFVTGEDRPDDEDSIHDSDTTDSDEFGETDHFGAPTREVMGDQADAFASEEKRRDIVPPRHDDEKKGDDEHLGVSGDYDEVDETQTIPAAPEEGEPDHDAAPAEDHPSDESTGYSAAWSTPAGVVGKSPEKGGGSTGFRNLQSGSDDASTGQEESASAVGDLGTTTQPSGVTEEAGGAGHLRDERESLSRKSRKQRKMQSDWVPEGSVRGDGNPVCPSDFPIKGNASSRIYHRPTDPSYEPTIPEFCFASEEAAQKAGFRAPRG